MTQLYASEAKEWNFLQLNFVSGMPLSNKKLEYCSTIKLLTETILGQLYLQFQQFSNKKMFNKIIVIMSTNDIFFTNSDDNEMVFLYFHEVQFCGSQSVEVTFIHRQQLKTRNVLRRGRSLGKTFRKLYLLFLRHFKSTSTRHNFQNSWHNICGNP